MHFSAATLVTLTAATLAVAAPTNTENSYLQDSKNDLFERSNKKNNDWKKHEKVFYFDATYIVKATPDQVINTTQIPAPGQPGAKGLFKYGINIADNTICFNITLSGVTGAYQSAARTATHIHEAPKGRAGPPRLAFPNPIGPDDRRISTGCLTGPFTTGITGTDGKDTGAGFHVSRIVANPSAFFTDTHTAQFVPGAVRGQLA